MIPNFSNAMFPKGHDEASQARIKRFMTIMDSMTDKELDSSATKIFAENGRVLRLSKGSGRPMYEVEALLEEYKRLSNVFLKGFSKMKLPKNAKGAEAAMSNPRLMQGQLNTLTKALPPQMLNQLGGIGGLQKMMQAMDSKKS